MVITNKDTVLAFTEGRVNGKGDAGNIDIVLKRSTDKGATWSDLIVVADDGKNRVSNPEPIVIPSTGRILLLYCWNRGASGIERKVFLTYSDDDGQTWAARRDITAVIKPQLMKDWWYVTGPCHGIVKQRETNIGRVVASVNFGGEDGRSTLIYSDDNGDTWDMGARSTLPSNESTVAELSNGNLMLNMRNAVGSNNRERIVAISSDAGRTFDTCYHDEQLTEPVFEGSLLFHSVNFTTHLGNLLFSSPPKTTNRTNNTLKLSTDDGRTWSKALQYVPDGETGGYSDLAVFPDGTIAVLYESGYLNSVGIAFKLIKLSDLQ